MQRLRRRHHATWNAAWRALLIGSLATATVWASHNFSEKLRLKRQLDACPMAMMGQVSRIGQFAKVQTRNTSEFESGNIGLVTKEAPTKYTVHMRSDNDDALPHSWRQWYYFRLDDLPVNEPVTLTIEGLGLPHYFLPFYSLDNVDWIQFPGQDVTQPTPQSLRIVGRFPKSQIWFARYIPYSYSRLQRYLNNLGQHPDLAVTDVGRTTAGHKMPLVTITDQAAIAPKERVIIHARTHPGEVGSSYVIEGLINFLLSDSELARSIKQRVIFSIIPMVNIDGVIAGNNRTTPSGINLEGQWVASVQGGLKLDANRAPKEVRLLNKAFRDLLATGVPVTMALNLHTSAGQPSDQIFAFPHFGPTSLGYSQSQAQLFEKQKKFINLLAGAYGSDRLMALSPDGGKYFVERRLPESWWWRHFQDRVMALTLESTYGMAGTSGHWVKPRDLRALGEALAQAIGSYHETALAVGRNPRPMMVQ